MGEEIIENWEEFLENARKKFQEKYSQKSESQLKTSDFTFVRTIGAGSFGRVVLVRRTDDARPYAIKILEKEKIVKYGELEHTLNEKRILQSIDFKFIVKMEDFFKDCCYLYIVMPFAPGGDFFEILRKLGKISDEASKFFSAQVLLALEYLHYLKIVYRDLKPENILIGKDGFLKLTDLGFCKMVNARTYTMCGTGEYLAPEIVRSEGYGLAVDWWSFGVLIYEMCVGSSPFFSTDEKTMFTSINKGKFNAMTLENEDTRDIVESLLQVNPTKRLGNLGNGAADIKNHHWFRNTSWLDVLNKRVEPPFLPKLSGPGDSSLFADHEDRPMRMTSKILLEEEFANF